MAMSALRAKVAVDLAGSGAGAADDDCNSPFFITFFSEMQTRA